MRIFSITSELDYSQLVLDQNKSATELVHEMERHFYIKDVPTTTIFILENTLDSNNVEFATFGDMFDTINEVLYEMHLNEKREEKIKEVLNKELCGWRFSETFLPYIKQLIYKAVEVHDIRAPQDKIDRS